MSCCGRCKSSGWPQGGGVSRFQVTCSTSLLGPSGTGGENLAYLIRSSSGGRSGACSLAPRLAVRGRVVESVGRPEQRVLGLPLVANNSRPLLPPWSCRTWPATPVANRPAERPRLAKAYGHPFTCWRLSSIGPVRAPVTRRQLDLVGQTPDEPARISATGIMRHAPVKTLLYR